MMQFYMIVGTHQFQQFNGLVVQAEPVEYLSDESTQTLTPLYLTVPRTHAPNGQEIYWQEKHLFPLQGFPMEELEDELQFV